MIMKSVFYGLFVSVLFLFAMNSCDNSTNTMEGYVEDIFTVRGNDVLPELADTFYYVKNLRDFDLQDGDRAVMRVSYYYDTYAGPRTARWQVAAIKDRIPQYGITSLTDIDTEEMNSHVSGLSEHYYGYKPVWLSRKYRNAYQNVFVKYYTDGTAPVFKMTTDGFVNDTLRLTLWSKISEGETETAQIMTFNLQDIPSMINNDERNELLSTDTLITKIKLHYKDYNKEDEEPYTAEIIGGKCVNPFR